MTRSAPLLLFTVIVHEYDEFPDTLNARSNNLGLTVDSLQFSSLEIFKNFFKFATRIYIFRVYSRKY